MSKKKSTEAAEPRKRSTKPKPEAAPKLREGMLYDPSALGFRVNTTQAAIAECLSDGKPHAIAELEKICTKAGRKGTLTIGFTTQRLKAAGFAISKEDGKITVTAGKGK